jgi:3-dehydroquinate dehydratase II
LPVGPKPPTPRHAPGIYGSETLAQIHERLSIKAGELSVALTTAQSNHEGTLCERIAAQDFDGLLLNAGAYTHTSIAIHDALRAVNLPCVEVHLSNPEAREEFRHKSLLAPACVGKVSGFAGESYILALLGLVTYLRR